MALGAETTLDTARRRAEHGERLSAADGLALARGLDLIELGRLADARRRQSHQRRASYIVNHHLNATNVCILRCKFCAFRRTRKEAGAYTLTPEEIWAEAERRAPEGVSEFHMANGLNPELKIDYYERYLRGLKQRFPRAHIKHFTAIEIEFMAKTNGLSIEKVLERLRQAGLDSLTGGGAETLSPRVRAEVCKGKLDGPGYLDTHRRAHRLGIPSTCTLLFGHRESLEERIEHLEALRGLQDETGGFTSFVPLVFSPPNTELDHLPRATGHQVLRMIALSRLMLDNFPSIKAYWISLGVKLAQLALHYGADDLDGTITSEQIHRSAEAPSPPELPPRRMRRLIREAGFEPWERDSLFRPLREAWPEEEEIPSPPVRLEDGSLSTVAEIDARIPPRAVDLDLVAQGRRRLNDEEALALLAHGSPIELARAAHAARLRLNPAPRVTYNVDRNVNPTDFCVLRCDFCAFAKRLKDPAGTILSREEMARKIDDLFDKGGRQLLLQSGLHPKLDLAWHEDLFRWMKRRWPTLHLHGLSPTEIQYLARRAGLDFPQTIARLREAGLDSIPGGGAEILTDRMRGLRSKGKVSADGWIECMRAAHGLGMKTTTTMVIGLGETLAERVEHLARARALQDETGGFTAFICWTFQTEDTPLAREIGPRAIEGYGAGAVDYLRTLALARLYLDNFPHCQSSWVTQGADIGQLALLHGADDLGSTMLEENVVSAAGTRFLMDEAAMRRLAEDLGFEARRRDFFYHVEETQTPA